MFSIEDFTKYEEFEDTKGVIRIRKSKKNRQHNGQNNDLQSIHIKRSSKTNPTKNPGRTQVLRKGKQFMLH